MDATCSDFNFGTALHIAAYNLCAGAVKTLLEHGANPAFRVRGGSQRVRTPHGISSEELNLDVAFISPHLVF